MSMTQRLDELKKKGEQAKLGGGPEKIESQHSRGKMTARERIDALVDPGTFVEIDRFVVHQTTDFGMAEKKILGDGVITGHARIDGRLVYLFSHDFTTFGGSLGEMFARKVTKIMDMALKTGVPVLVLNDSGGARIQEGVVSLGGYAEIFLRNTLASGVVPQISAIMGPCAGGAVYSPAITDFILMVKDTSYMFVTGPDVIKTVTHEEVTMNELGGAMTHGSTSGVAHFAVSDDRECLATIRELLSFLPSNNMEDPPVRPTADPPDREDEKLNTIVPMDPNQPYDMKEVIKVVVDKHHFFEVHKHFARNIVVGFGRL